MSSSDTNCHKNNTWWVFTLSTVNCLHIPQQDLSLSIGRSIHNFGDIKKSLGQRQLVGCVKYLVRYYTFHIQQLVCILTGTEVTQLVSALYCSVTHSAVIRATHLSTKRFKSVCTSHYMLRPLWSSLSVQNFVDELYSLSVFVVSVFGMWFSLCASESVTFINMLY
jgi:hypothetical protein